MTADVREREAEKSIAAVLRESGAAFWTRDPATLHLKYVNEGIEDVLGYPSRRFIEDRNFWEGLIAPHERSVTIDRLRELLRHGRTGSVDYSAIHADGSQVFLVDSVVAFGAGGIVAGVTALANHERLAVSANVATRQTSARKDAEELQRRQSQKMEAVGRLAAGIAHDFNNILTVITSYSQLLLSRFPPDDPGRADLYEIRKAADRAVAMVRQLLTFSHRSQGEQKIIDMTAALLETQKMLQQTVGCQIEIVVLVEPDAACCLADRAQLDQVLLNLALNARDAMPNGGTLSFELGTTVVDEAFARSYLDPDIVPGEYITLSVGDTGQGMDSRTRDRLFEPFFTTKAPGKGKGLGLSTVYGIIKQHGGAITLLSDVGRGTTFRIYLPRTSHPSHELIVSPGLPS